MTPIVIDSDIFIDFLRGFPPAKEFFSKLTETQVTAYYSVITEAELLSARDCNSLSRRRETEELLSLASPAEVTSSIAKKAGEFKRNYGAKLDDSIIAATAFTLKATIFTRNTKDFKKISECNFKEPY